MMKRIGLLAAAVTLLFTAACAEPRDKETGQQTAQEERTEMSRTEERYEAPVLVIEANGKRLYAALEDNASARAFIEKLSTGPVDVQAHDYGHFEKVGSLPWSLPRNDTRITTVPGDVILYEGDQITVYYDSNTWSFTRLARIGDTTKEALLEILGEGDVTLTFWVERNE